MQEYIKVERKSKVHHFRVIKLIRVVVIRKNINQITTEKKYLVLDKKYNRYFKKRTTYKIPTNSKVEVGDIIKIAYIGRLLSPTISHVLHSKL